MRSIGAVLIIGWLWCPVAAAHQWAEGEPIPSTGHVNPDLGSLDRLMESFLRENQLPGGSLTVARHGRLVYARGFGYADVTTRDPVRPDSLFRIASVSKPITAVAVLQLVDAGRMALRDRVEKLLPPDAGPVDSSRGDPRWGDVTVEHLLQHRGGWDSRVSGYPMFRSVDIATALGTASPPGTMDIMRYMRAQPLDFDPGARYAYSNFGYCVLGRLIECVTGCDYETHVRSHLLAPRSIERMRIGKTRASDRAEGEVRYYERDADTGPSVWEGELGQLVPRPYGAFCIETMDAHGGWIASAVDLARFGSGLGQPAPEGILSAAAWSAMIACPPGAAGHEEDGRCKASYYGLGWQVRPIAGQERPNLWHIGQLPGTSSILVLRHDGFCWAALFNASEGADGRAPADKIDGLIHGAVDAVARWPQDDLSSGEGGLDR